MHAFSEHAEKQPSLKDLLGEDDEFDVPDDSPSYSSSHDWLRDDKPSAPSNYTPPAPSAPSTAGATTDKYRYYKALQGWVQALNEAAPLYFGERARNPDLPAAQLKRNVARACADHLALVGKALDINSAEETDIMYKYWRRIVGRNLAPLYLKASPAELEGLIEVAREWMLSADEYESQLPEEPNQNVMLTIKMALFTGALDASINLAGLWGSYIPIEVVKELQKSAINLAREVAFTWSVKSDIADKEILFKSVLPACLQACALAYRKAVAEELDPVEYLESDPDMALPVFEDAVRGMHMGYVGEEQVALFSRVRGLAKSYVANAKAPELDTEELVKWRSMYLAALDNLLGECWIEATERFIAELQTMSDEEKAVFASAGSKMDYRRFDLVFKANLDRLDDPLSDIEVNLTSIAVSARQHLSWVWGISDALVEARKEASREDYT
ncbi:hypothetical protein ACYPKM_02920 [Pseudomonas aeruginosa]